MSYAWQAKGNSASAGVEDMVSEQQIVENLYKRYQADLIYTYIGPVLIALNPYKGLPYFTQKEIDVYHGSAAYENPPHIYALAETMFQNMLIDEENQCVIISGESGAGKTESSKLLMNYIASVSGKGGSGVDEVKRIILGSNPLLEAFGNAKTLRNNNSSRFGKYFEIKFSSGTPVGGNISNFLLEKSRVVGQKLGERNYHIFYQLTKGASREEKEQLGTSDPSYFNYLSQSGTYDVEGIDDVAEYAEMKEAMGICGIGQNDRVSLLQIAAGVLHLGNIRFVEQGNFATVADDQCIDQGLLKTKLLSRMMTTGGGQRGSIVDVQLTVQQAVNSRDALAKALYSRIFDYIIVSINAAIQKTPSNGKILNLGVLDIYGFEIFEKNGFEQLCINYVNEKLQQVFIELTLKSEQEEYVREGIQWTPIEFFNNKIVVDLIEGKRPSGIMAVLDDICAQLHAVTEGADAKFVQKLDSTIGQHAHYVGRGGHFVVTHYAGQVSYDSEGFCESNKDTLFRDLVVLMQSTNNSFIRNLFPEDVAADDKKRPTTASFKIRNQCNVLVETLMKCTPSYIRCIKPNEKKKPKDWDSARCEHQVRYLNLRENINVRRAGFCYRSPFDKFLRRYMLLTPQTYPRWNGNPNDGVTHILKSVDLERSQWQLGKSKVFIKAPESLFMLEELRERTYHEFAKKIQRCYRRWKARKYYLDCKKKTLNIFVGKKERRRITLNREFIGDYLNILSNPILRNLVGKNDKILFCNTVTKYDRRMKPQQKELFISDYTLSIVGTEKIKSGPNKGKMDKVINRKIPLDQISKISLSTCCDDFFVVHVDSEYDNVFECVLKTELCVVLCEAYERLAKRKLDIVFLNKISYTVKKTKWESAAARTLIFAFNHRLMLEHSKVLTSDKGTTLIGTTAGLPKESQPSVQQGSSLAPRSQKTTTPMRSNQPSAQSSYQNLPPPSRPPPMSSNNSYQNFPQPPYQQPAAPASPYGQPANSYQQPAAPQFRPPMGGMRPPMSKNLGSSSNLDSRPSPAKNSLSSSYNVGSMPSLAPQQNQGPQFGMGRPAASNQNLPYGGTTKGNNFNTVGRSGTQPNTQVPIMAGHAGAPLGVAKAYAAAKGKPVPVPPKPKVDQAKALYDYKAKEADELNMSVGDVVTIVSRDNEGWWTGVNRGRRGLFPANYVQAI